MFLVVNMKWNFIFLFQKDIFSCDDCLLLYMKPNLLSILLISLSRGKAKEGEFYSKFKKGMAKKTKISG